MYLYITMKKALTLLSISLVLVTATAAQEELVEDGAFGLFSFNVSYGLQMPLGDLADRFGRMFEIGSDLDYINSQSYIIGLAGRFSFGDRVNEDPIQFLRNQEGFIASPGGVNVPVFLRSRAFYLGGHVGKLFQLSSTHKLSNVRATIGAGLLQHRIRLLDESQSLPIVEGDYGKGLDRLSNGLAFRSQLGYQRIDREGFLHFYIGLELAVGFTQSRRDFDFQLGARDETSRTDILLGVRAAWTLPLGYTSDQARVYFY